MMPPGGFAVYAEHSDSDKPMAKGMNIRVFNRTEVQHGATIRLEACTGTIHLSPGAYHVTASSMVTYVDPDAKDPTTVPMVPAPFGGYCRLRHLENANCPNEQAICVGTISNADMLPSLIDTYVLVENDARIVLEHQIGDNVDGIYLQVNAGGSSWHVFARISIHRL
jgi:hypothetical protein